MPNSLSRVSKKIMDMTMSAHPIRMNIRDSQRPSGVNVWVFLRMRWANCSLLNPVAARARTTTSRVRRLKSSSFMWHHLSLNEVPRALDAADLFCADRRLRHYPLRVGELGFGFLNLGGEFVVGANDGFFLISSAAEMTDDSSNEAIFP